MDKWDRQLLEILNSNHELLDVKPKVTANKSADQKMIDSFLPINEFYQTNQREPLPGQVHEAQLYYRLKGIRENSDKIAKLKQYDTYNLLKSAKKEIKSIEDIFSNDDFGLLSDDAENIFSFKNIPKETSMPEYVASRKVCTDFSDFEQLLKNCQLDLKNGKRKLLPFANEQQISQNHFYVLKGVLLFVAEVGERKRDDNRKVNARLRCIFENGTESDMLLRSLAAELYKDGRRVTEIDEKLLDKFQNISDEDQQSGFIYVLQSKSSDERIRNIENLYKIGFSKIPVAERIKNAEQEPTYLLAPVKIIAIYQCYNLNPQKLELLLHSFFCKVCLNLDIYDKNRNRHIPREWFVVPLNVVEKTIVLIINGEIVNYKYNEVLEEIVKI